MDKQQVIGVLETERACVLRNIEGCDRKCERCDLVMDDQDIIEGYNLAITNLQNQPYINQDIIEKSISHYGGQLISTIAMEECAELIQAISKYQRGKPDNDNLAEEIADVLISIENMKSITGVSNQEIQKWIDYKQQRSSERVDNNVVGG